MINLKDLSHSTRSSANTSAIQSETPGGWSSCKCLDDMRLMQRLAISGLLSVILILLLTGTIVTRRDTLASVIDRGVAPEERNEQLNPAWVQDNVVPGQNEPEIEDRDKDKDRRLDIKHKQSEPSAVGPPAASVPGAYVIRPPNPPLDDVTNQRREKVKEVRLHRVLVFCMLGFEKVKLELSVEKLGKCFFKYDYFDFRYIFIIYMYVCMYFLFFDYN